MDGESRRLRDTREFVAQWSAATEAHLVDRLEKVLADLVTGGVLPSLAEEQRARLAAVLAHAFRVSASPEGGPHEAVAYLSGLAARSGERTG